jgi:pimeloyl-ACP methyl ester carboxylesterase
MPRVEANGIELEYDTFGDPGDPALVLVMGLRGQLIDWDPGFCELLTGHGFRVIRFDNRDAGLSTALDDQPAPDLGAIVAGDHGTVPYRVPDMAADLVGLLDALGIAKAHVAGVSMGGMIVQQSAIDHPERVLSLCSIMSTTGDPAVGQAKPEAMQVLTQPAPEGREAIIEQTVRAFRTIGSTGFPISDDDLRVRVTADYDRSYRPAGGQRQLAAIMASPSRTEGLHGVTAPALVIHGEADPLIDPSGGQATAAAIPGAELLTIPGMGHDLPKDAWPQITHAIATNAKRA